MLVCFGMMVPEIIVEHVFKHVTGRKVRGPVQWVSTMVGFVWIPNVDRSGTASVDVGGMCKRRIIIRPLYTASACT